MKTFIIAEVGINHNGDITVAKRLIDEAKNCGADAVKFQTFKAEEFITDFSLTYTYVSQGHEITEPQIEMFKRCEFDADQWEEIFNHCEEVGILGFTTPQNKADLDFILGITDLKLLKVGSDDLTNLPLLKYYASQNIPLIVSTGMAYEKEIENAIKTIFTAGCEDLTVLHCVSMYPAPFESVNMKKMATLRSKFGIKVGFSDHTIGPLSAIVAVSLGATVVEKHFTLDKDSLGPDHSFSATPFELSRLVDNVRQVESILGNGALIPTLEEQEMRILARRSIVFAANLERGTLLKESHFDFKRPGDGIPPSEISNIVGKKLKHKVSKNLMLQYDMIVK